MRVLHLYHGVHPGRGVESFIRDLTNGLKDKYEQFLAVPRGKYQDAGFALNGVFELDRFSDLIKIVKENKIDIIQVHWTGAETFYKHELVRIKDRVYRQIVNENDKQQTPENNPYGFVNIFSLWALFFWDEIEKKRVPNKERPKIIICTHTEDPLPEYISFPVVDEIVHVSRKVQNLNKAKSTVIYPGVNVDKFKPIEKKEISKLKIGYVGSLEKFDVGFMNEIKKEKYQKYEFLFYGENKGFESLDNIKFMGKVNDIHSILNEIDIFLYPSTRDSLSIACIEAMSSGLPIVASETVREVLKSDYPQTGIILQDENDLFKALNDLEDKNLREILSETARNRAIKHFTLSNFINNYDSLYQSLKS